MYSAAHYFCVKPDSKRSHDIRSPTKLSFLSESAIKSVSSGWAYVAKVTSADNQSWWDTCHKILNAMKKKSSVGNLLRHMGLFSACKQSDKWRVDLWIEWQYPVTSSNIHCIHAVVFLSRFFFCCSQMMHNFNEWHLIFVAFSLPAFLL